MQVGFAQNGYSHVCSAEFRSTYIRQAQIDVAKLRALRLEGLSPRVAVAGHDAKGRLVPA